MTDRHAQNPISIRPPKDDRAWLESYARDTGRPVRAIIVEALAEYRARRTAASARGIVTPHGIAELLPENWAAFLQDKDDKTGSTT